MLEGEPSLKGIKVTCFKPAGEDVDFHIEAGEKQHNTYVLYDRTHNSYERILHCWYCSTRFKVLIPEYIPRSQHYQYVEVISKRINRGEMKLNG